MSGAVDLAVIGGGIHGVGVAQAAAAAGWSVTLLEQYPGLAQGTSSRSSKLIHGGLRYLESGQFHLVRESLAERELLLRIAPELVTLSPFHIPVYAGSRRPGWQVRAGLSLYAMLGNLGKHARFGTLPRTAWDRLDGLTTEGLKAVYRYYDGQTDDAALTRAVMASARSLGATLELSARVEAVELGVDGVTLRYLQRGQDRELRARAVVNASGPWVNRVLATARPAQRALDVELVQGAHLVLPGRLMKGIYYVEAPDGRVIFAIPWRENIMVGTTETPWTDDPAASYPLDSEIDYLLASFRRVFPTRGVAKRDVVAAFAGLRVLPGGGGAAFGRSREDVLLTDGGRPPRLLSIYGGKLTTYRATAAKVIAKLAAALPAREPRGDTRELTLSPVD
ncbi:MAG: glycerol-3-phosphate dehydrogenase/oxidase [Candidatus Krumholzibacteriia bacterium]